MKPLEWIGMSFPNESCKNCKHKTKTNINGIKWGCSKHNTLLKTLKGYCFIYKWNGDVK